MADVNLISGIDGTWVNPGAVEYDAGELRRADAAMFSSGGVARGLDVTVTASDEVRVAAGSWVIDGDETSLGAGVYRGGIGSQVSDYLEPRDATYGRVDLVVARQYDADVVGSHTGYQAAVEVLTGTPSANPSAPALPDLAIELARLDVPADGGGAVAVDTTNRIWAASLSSAFRHHVMLRRVTNLGFAANEINTIWWDGLERQVGNMWSSGSSTFVRIRRSGLYTMSLNLNFSNQTSNTKAGGWIELNDSRTMAAGSVYFTGSSLAYKSLSCSTVAYLDEGDYLRAGFRTEAALQLTAQTSAGSAGCVFRVAEL